MTHREARSQRARRQGRSHERRRDLPACLPGAAPGADRVRAVARRGHPMGLTAATALMIALVGLVVAVVLPVWAIAPFVIAWLLGCPALVESLSRTGSDACKRSPASQVRPGRMEAAKGGSAAQGALPPHEVPDNRRARRRPKDERAMDGLVRRIRPTSSGGVPPAIGAAQRDQD